MALDATIGGADANSYATAAVADAYFADRNPAWDGFDAAAKDQALIRATQWLDATYRDRWPGERLNGRGQALEWPRSNAYDINGHLLPTDEIPIEVIHAQCEAALSEAASPGGLTPEVKGDKVLIGVDSLRWQVTGTGADAQRPQPVIVDDILGSLIGKRSATEMLLRA